MVTGRVDGTRRWQVSASGVSDDDLCLAWVLHDGIGISVNRYCGFVYSEDRFGTVREVPVVAAWIPASSAPPRNNADNHGRGVDSAKYSHTVLLSIAPSGTDAVAFTTTDARVQPARKVLNSLASGRLLFYAVVKGGQGVRSVTVVNGNVRQIVHVGIIGPS